MGHIFISYSHKDSSYVRKLAATLEEEGFEIWIDDRIHYGSEWPRVVTRNLDASDGVIVVLSNNSYESDMVQNEVARAREKKKPIFPLLLSGDNWL
ncbi:MAG: toll/interleukin-1 receptor domain-containing protein, partial [Anaerolineales bacterium]